MHSAEHESMDPINDRIDALLKRADGKLTDAEINETYQKSYPTHTSVFFHVCSPTVPRSTDVTIYALLRALERTKGLLPPNLVIQLDNCGSQNKNNPFIQFCAVLVNRGLFKKIRITFLPVGHTHCDIDQMFSKWVDFISRHNVYTIDELVSLISLAYTPIPEGEWNNMIPDFLGWLKTGKFRPIQGISFPKHIKIFKDSTGTTLLKAKHHDFDPKSSWSEPIEVIKSEPLENPVAEGRFFFREHRPIPDMAYLDEHWERWLTQVPRHRRGSWRYFFESLCFSIHDDFILTHSFVQRMSTLSGSPSSLSGRMLPNETQPQSPAPTGRFHPF